ncbi:MAG: hypothetical protein ACKODX_01330, partial [Gemmata sp.]
MSEPAAPSPSAIRKLEEWNRAQEEAERELAAADAAAAGVAAAAVAPAAEASGAAAAPRRAGALKRVLPAVAVAALCAGGPVASALYFWTKPKPKQETKAEAEPPPPEPVTPDSVDALIRGGAFADALAACRRPGPEPTAPQRRAWAYREAVCLEGLGRLQEAAEHYRKSEPPDGDRAMWARALLVLARCALAADDIDAAQKYVSRVALRSGHADCAGTHVAEECAFMRARLAAARMGAVRALDPFDPSAVAWPGLGGSHDEYLEWLPPDTPAAAGAAAPGATNVFEVRRTDDGFEVTAHAAERPAADAVVAIAAAAGLKLQLDAATAALLKKDASAIDVNALLLAEVLAAMLGPAG